MKKEFNIEIPKTPNFIKVEGLKDLIPIEDFTEQDLKYIGEEWTKELIRRSKLKLNPPTK